MSQDIATWYAQCDKFMYKGHEIVYRDEGEGEVLLCVHGFPTASWDWYKIWPALTAQYRVIAPDMLGFGFSAKPRKHQYSIMEQATLHEALLAHLGVTEAHVLAHDYGDTVAQEMLARQQDRAQESTATQGLSLRSQIFLNGGLFPETHRPRLIQRLLLTPLGPVLGHLLSKAKFTKNITAVFGPNTQPTAHEIGQMWALVTHNEGKRITHKLLHYIPERKQNRERWTGAMQRSTIPLRFINGSADPVSGRHAAERYEALIPKPDVVHLAGIGHWPQIEAPEAVAEAALSFFNKAHT